MVHIPHLKRVSLLSADIGGTNTRFELHEYRVYNDNTARSCDECIVIKQSYENEKFPSFTAVLKQFLHTCSGGGNTLLENPPIAACLAVAGPVKGNAVRFTNRGDWNVRET